LLLSARSALLTGGRQAGKEEEEEEEEAEADGGGTDSEAGWIEVLFPFSAVAPPAVVGR
jgi:hypothetical protein